MWVVLSWYAQLTREHPWTIKAFCRLSTADVPEMHGTDELPYHVEFQIEITRWLTRVAYREPQYTARIVETLCTHPNNFDKRFFIHRWSYQTWRWTACMRSWCVEAREALSTIGWLYAEKVLLHRRCAAFAIATEHRRYCHTVPYGSAAEWLPGWSALVWRWCWWSRPSSYGSEDQSFVLFHFKRLYLSCMTSFSY